MFVRQKHKPPLPELIVALRRVATGPYNRGLTLPKGQAAGWRR